MPGSFNFEIFVSSLTEEYAGIKAFHGCRPKSVSSYYEYGFSADKHASLKQQFMTIYSDVDAELAGSIFESIYQKRSDENFKTYFLCDTDRLVNGGSGHYLIYGSELILCAAQYLEEELEIPLTDRLKSYGVPTIVEVNLPFGLVPSNQVTQLAKVLLAAWGTHHLFPEYAENIEFVVITRGEIPPSHIANHHHPRKILNRRKLPPTYHYFDGCCDMCQT